VSFLIKLFSLKGNLVIMNNLYRKVALTSVGITLCFALGANKEAKAATITLKPTTSFGVRDLNITGLGDSYYSGTPFHVGTKTAYISGQWPGEIAVLQQDRAFYEFNIANLSLASNTVISNAIFQVSFDSLTVYHRYYSLELFGYIGNGQPDTSDFSRGIGRGFQGGQAIYLSSSDFDFLDLGNAIQLQELWWGGPYPVEKFNFNFNSNQTLFVKELIRRKNAFAGFSFRHDNYNIGDATLNHMDASLIITTVDVAEPVPEPTTIFGSALALSLGGWLKRKKSSQHNKTTP
jgi:hypothetical protein